MTVYNLVLEAISRFADSKFVEELTRSDIEKYKLSLRKFLDQQKNPAKEEQAEHATALVNNNEIVGLWEHQESSHHNYYEPFFQVTTAKLVDVLPIMFKNWQKHSMNKEVDIMIPKKMDSPTTLQKLKSIIPKNAKLETISRYTGLLTIEIG